MRKLELINEILTIQMNHWVLYPVALTVIGLVSSFIGEGRPATILWAICGLMALIFFGIREKVNRLWLFLLLNLVAAALFFILPVQTLAERVICAACSVVYFIGSMVKRFREEGSSNTQPANPVVAISVSAGAILLQHYQGQPSWDLYYVLTLVGVLALCLITSYIRHYLEFLVVNESSTGYLPAEDIFRSGMGLVGIYTVLGAVVLLLGTSFGWLATIWNGMKYVITAVLRFLISFFPNEQVSEEEILISDTPVAESTEELVLPEAKEPFLIWQILEVIVIIAFFCAMIYVIIRQLINLVKYIRKRFGAGFGHHKQLVTGEEEIDVREKCDLARTSEEKKPIRSFFGFLTPAERVRKLYRKKILASAFELTGGGEDSTALSLITPRECGEKLGATAMSDIYEQVRYSDQETTQDTLRRMKEACKG